jgi:methionyl-tRNA formyltransferase
VSVPIGTDTTFGELEHMLCQIGKHALLDVIRAFEVGEPPRIPQDHSQATFAPKIELEDCEIRWNRSAQELHNLVRGVNPYPGAWCTVDVQGEKKRLKIWRTRIIPCETMQPGILLNPDQAKSNLLVSTGKEALELLEVQLEGKKRMPSESMRRGMSFLQFNFEQSSKNFTKVEFDR